VLMWAFQCCMVNANFVTCLLNINKNKSAPRQMHQRAPLNVLVHRVAVYLKPVVDCAGLFQGQRSNDLPS
jgi:hypothetical protein